MQRSFTGDLSLLVMRFLIAAIFLWHGVPKAFDIPAAMEKFVGFGLPAFLGPVTGWAEVIVAPLLLFGILNRISVAVLGAIILGALVTVQIPGGVTAGLERDLMILTGLIVLWAFGPGKYAAGSQAGS